MKDISTVFHLRAI